MARRICVPKSSVSRRIVDFQHFTIRHHISSLNYSQALRRSEGKSNHIAPSCRSNFAACSSPSGITDRTAMDITYEHWTSESWFSLSTDHEMNWLRDGDEPRNRENHMIPSPKWMPTFVWDRGEFQFVDAMPNGKIFRPSYDIRNSLTEVVARCEVKGGWWCMGTMKDHICQM
jgi:hypothetical protein